MALSEKEAAVYDRQLRLWGMKAQQRLMQSKVLVWGLEGSNVEVCKNLILAGVALTVRDHRSVGNDDVDFNYFLRAEDLGKSRAECSAARLQEMNPLSVVGVSKDEPPAPEAGDAKFSETIKGFDVVCIGFGVINWDVARACAIDAACRASGACCFLSVSAGELAFFFSDLNEHIMQERASAQSGGAGTTASTENSSGPETFSFASLKEWVACQPSVLLKEKVDPSVLLVSLFLAFRQQSGGVADVDAGEKFAEYCTTAKCEPELKGMPVLKDMYSLFFVEPLMHVASIMGGLMAQEVIKAITKRDPPLVNCVCFNAHTGASIVERIPSQVASKKRKVEEVALDLDD
jgi:ubiquitin-like 1-activating enzyme E1 A